MSIDKDKVFNSPPQLHEIDMPEWGGRVFIRSMTVDEQAKMMDLGKRFENSSGQDRTKNLVLRVITWCVVDENYAPEFTAEDIPRMLPRPVYSFMRIFDEILRISGLTKEARNEIAKNFESDQSAE